MIPAANTALTITEWDVPETALGWLALCGVAVAVLLYVVYLGRRDTRAFPWYVTTLLTTLRLGVVVILGIIWLNPRERTQEIIERPSRLAILVDTSQSMRDPNRTPSTQNTAELAISRTAAARALLAETPVLEELGKIHELHLFTFDSELTPQGILRDENTISARNTFASEAPADGQEDQTEPLDWEAILEPTGTETRLGNALSELVRTMRGPTLAGIVLVSDGGLNAGSGVDNALTLAGDAANSIQIATVGLGGLEPPANLMITDVRAPSEVRYNRELSEQDSFEVVAFIQGNELGGRKAKIELLRHPADAEPETATVLASTEITLPEQGRPAEVRFPQTPDTAGEFRYIVRARTVEPIAEYRKSDNQSDATVTFSERNTAVLLVAGGPMRDYRFVRNLLFRSATVDVDVWLQTVSPSEIANVSQESADLLVRFPENFPERPITERLPEGSPAPKTYDVVVMFDPDWSRIPEVGRTALAQWISSQRGGLILVAGNVFTPLLADAGEKMADVRALYPVELSNRYLIEMIGSEASQAWPIEFTEAGQAAGFLQLAEDPTKAANIWSEFEGIYRAFPTRGAKDLAEVYATFPDPKMAAEGAPVVFAAQQYGGGRVLYIGSPEIWRLREVGVPAFDTFWVKAIREAGQGRLRRGDGPGIFLLDRESYLLGETVRVRARLSTPQGEPLTLGDVEFQVTDPEGRAVFPGGREVPQDSSQPGQYTATFRAAVPGRYQVRLEIPSRGESMSTTIDVELPRLEQLHPEQNRALLVQIAERTRGQYMTIEQAAMELPELFQTSAAVSMPIDERLQTLWDRAWLMYLVVGLLCVEWLIRKFLKLA